MQLLKRGNEEAVCHTSKAGRPDLAAPVGAGAQVLEAAGIRTPRALAVVYTARARSVAAVRGLREGAQTLKEPSLGRVAKIR
jgi:hypothetical protein